MENINFVITQENHIRFTLRGRLDANNAVELEQKLKNIKIDEQPNVVLNMLYVEYLCSTGIRVLLKAYKELTSAGGTFGIESPSECVKNVLGLVALTEMLIE